MRKIGYQACARQYLAYARKEAGKNSPVQVVDGYITIMIKFLDTSGYTLEDIGTSQTELEKLIDQATEI